MWQTNTVSFPQERLLGVSLTGIMDNRLMSGQLGMDSLASALDEVKQAAVKVGVCL